MGRSPNAKQANRWLWHFLVIRLSAKNKQVRLVQFFWMTSWLFNQKEGLCVHVTDGCCSQRPAIQPFFRVKTRGGLVWKEPGCNVSNPELPKSAECCFGRTDGEFCSVFFHLWPTPRLWSWQEDLEKDGEEANGAVDDPPPEEGGHPVGGPKDFQLPPLDSWTRGPGRTKILCKVRDGRFFFLNECPVLEKHDPRGENLRVLCEKHTFYNVTQTCDILPATTVQPGVWSPKLWFHLQDSDLSGWCWSNARKTEGPSGPGLGTDDPKS